MRKVLQKVPGSRGKFLHLETVFLSRKDKPLLVAATTSSGLFLKYLFPLWIGAIEDIAP